MSIAAITACSASGARGAVRSRNGSRACVVEDSSSELHIFPCWPLPRWIAQKRGRMIGDDHGNAVIAVNRAAQLPDRQLGFEQRLRGEGAEGENDLWAHQLDLANEVWAAGAHLVRHRIAIAWRPVLQDVEDEHL